MKKTTLWTLAVLLTVFATGMSLTGCSDHEDGESNDEYVLRNALNGPSWKVYSVLEDGAWNTSPNFYFEVRFSASNKNFKSEKWMFENGYSILDTKESYSFSDPTAYTISGNKVEATVGGQPYFRMEVLGEVSYTMHCKLYFYNTDETYEVYMDRGSY